MTSQASSSVLANFMMFFSSMFMRRSSPENRYKFPGVYIVHFDHFNYPSQKKGALHLCFVLFSFFFFHPFFPKLAGKKTNCYKKTYKIGQKKAVLFCFKITHIFQDLISGLWIQIRVVVF